MRIEYDHTFSHAVGNYFEIDELKKILTVGEQDPICLLDEEGRFYSGLLDKVVSGLTEKDILHDVVEPFRTPVEVDIDPECLVGRTLRDYQVRCLRKALLKERGIIEVATGGGKTEIAAAIIKHLMSAGKKKFVFVAGSIFLMEQAAERFERLGLSGIIRIGGGHKGDFSTLSNDEVQIYVGVSNSLAKRLRKADLDIDNFDCLILDEAHHTSAKSWVFICTRVNARFRFGLTATAFWDPKELTPPDYFLLGLAGPIIIRIKSKFLRNRGYLAEPLVTMFPIKSWVPFKSWKKVYDHGIVSSRIRNRLALTIAMAMYEHSHRTMIFVTRINHGLRLLRSLHVAGCEDVIFVHGGSAVHFFKDGEQVLETWSITEVASYINSREKCILIASSVLDEGVDIPTVDTLIMCAAMKKYRRTVQRSGRGMRPKPGSNRVFIFDFLDNHHYFLKNHSKYRAWTYEQEQMEMSESTAHLEEVLGHELDLTIRYEYLQEAA